MKVNSGNLSGSICFLKKSNGSYNLSMANSANGEDVDCSTKARGDGEKAEDDKGATSEPEDKINVKESSSTTEKKQIKQPK